MNNDRQIPGLLEWKEPAQQLKEYGAPNFRVFYPSIPNVGIVYNVIEDKGERSGVYLHSYRSPKPKHNEVLLHALLSQLHPSPFVYTRFGPRGTRAIVRAKNGDLLDIVIR